ncbi:MAG: hypothetical protein AB7K24_21765, partial [Gemmataceae bacterium]
IKVNVWRDRENSDKVQTTLPMIVAGLSTPLNNPNQQARIAGKYEVVVEWTYLFATAPGQPYAVQQTKTTKTSFEVE